MTASLCQRVEEFGRPNVLVLGDLILDRYIWGDAERISQEAPVILLRADKREERLGGAASVAMMLAALGADVSLAGVLGDDESAARCRELLDAHSIHHDLVEADPMRPSTLKERYIGRAQQKHPQQMMRVDYETRDQISEEIAGRLLEGITKRLGDFDIVLISDYDKGACAPPLLRKLIDACRNAGKRVLVDPIRGGDYAAKYHGCHAMTPNRFEAGLAAQLNIHDLDAAAAAASKLKQQLAMEVGIVTLDRDGMILADQAGQIRHFPIRERQVYDITGAGDMVLAVLGVALAAGADYPEAIQLANTAGGLVVERIGVATVSREEIIHDLLHGDNRHHATTLNRDDLVLEVNRCRREGKRIVFTNGCFDILHVGHVRMLQEARSQGEVLVVGLNSDASVSRLKGPSRPINDEVSRAAVLSALDSVDLVCVFDEETPLELIKAVQPDVLVKGSDYQPDEVVGWDVVKARGGRLHLVDLVDGKSTTQVVRRIEENKHAA